MGAAQSYITVWDKTQKHMINFKRDNFSRENAIATYKELVNHGIPSISDFIYVVREAAKLFQSRPSLVEITPKPNDRMVFVGDVHGCFETIMRMWTGESLNITNPDPKGISGSPTSKPHSVGFPGLNERTHKRNIFLFNGDLVDRGGSGYQVVFILSLFALACPDCIYINRGNHESAMFGLNINQDDLRGKFMEEILGKFPNCDIRAVRASVAELFYALPIGHLIDKNVFICHAGVPRGESLTEAIQHFSHFTQRRNDYYYNDLNSQIMTDIAHAESKEDLDVLRKVKPYKLSDLNTVNRFAVETFEDAPTLPETMWHSFLWSYDRLPYAADFMKYNGIKCMVNSHSATAYHNITTFVAKSALNNNLIGPARGPAAVIQYDVIDSSAILSEYAMHSVAKNDQQMVQVRKQYHNAPTVDRVSIVEIFSSPTNAGSIYCAIVDAQKEPNGEAAHIDSDPFCWTYVFLGHNDDFKYNRPEQTNSPYGQKFNSYPFN